jgi:hypothetical protein
MNSNDDKIFYENLPGYAFGLMILFILIAVNILLIIIPVTVIYTRIAHKYIQNYDWIYRTGRLW